MCDVYVGDMEIKPESGSLPNDIVKYPNDKPGNSLSYVFLVRPKAIACRADLSFSPDVLFFISFNARYPRCVGRLA